MENNGIKRLRGDVVRFGKLNTPGNRSWQAFCQVAMECIIRPQDEATYGSHRGNLYQCILFVIGDTQHTFARQQRPGIALAGGSWQQALRSGLCQFAKLLTERMQRRAIDCPCGERFQRLNQR